MEEQARTNNLAEDLRQKEVSERKAEAETESLNFRNQQLTKRIQVMQKEIEALQHRSTKQGKKKSSPSVEAIQSSEMLNSVIGQELQAKIEENARLHARLADVDGRYEDLVNSLQSRINELEAEARRKAQEERAQDGKQKDLMAGLKSENVELQRRVRELEQEVSDEQDRVTVLTVQLESASNHAADGQKANADDFFPLTADDAKVQTVELLSQFGEGVTSLVAAFSDFHTYWEHRLKDAQPDGLTSEGSSRLSKLLLQNVKYLKPVETDFQSILSQVLSGDFAGGILKLFEPFCVSFRRYVEYACEAESLTVQCLQYESNLYSCPPSQQSLNDQLNASLRSFNRVLVRVSDYLDTLCRDDTAKGLKNLSVAMSQLVQQASELQQAYESKANDENQLPTVTDQLRNTNRCIVSSLSSMSSAIQCVSRGMSDNMTRALTLVKVSADLLSNVASAKPEGANDVAVPEILEENGGSMAERALIEDLTEEKDNQARTIATLNDKIKNLEQSRDRWKVEFELTQMKYDTLKEERGGGAASSQEDLIRRAEEAVKKPLLARLEQLLTERLLADSKATSFFLECQSLQKRLRSAAKVRTKLQMEFKDSEKRVEDLKDEVASTAATYKSELDLMTEHVANMNDKLSSQTDEIASLRYELNNKGKKK